MTERERWIVYPLLFLALGAATRDKLVDRTMTKSIVCQELAIVDEETTGRHSPRVLARLGRGESKSTGEATAHFLIDGHIDVVDSDPTLQPPRALIHIGRTDPSAGAPSSGYVVVDGAINAKMYAYQSIPFMPTWHPLPGVSFPDVLRALQHGSSTQPKSEAPDAQSSRRQSQVPPSDAKPKDDRKATSPPVPATGEAPPAK